ncbi:MAG: trypsin-like peptidase domain-containing protein [Anaerolineae bacterium]
MKLRRRPLALFVVVPLVFVLVWLQVACRGSTPTPTPLPSATPTYTPTATNTLPPTITPTATSTPVAWFGPIVFGIKAEGLQIQNPGTSFPASTRTVYAAWEYRNLRDGLIWKRCWYFDNTLRSCDSFTWNVKMQASSGKAFITEISDPAGLPPGTYRLELFIEEHLVSSASFDILAPPPTPTPIPTLTPTPLPGREEIGRRAALSLVRLEVPALRQGGSGAIVDGRNGLVLTNWHVVTDHAGQLPEDELVAVFRTLDPDQPPVLSYWARVLPSYSDPEADLALLQIVAEKDGKTPVGTLLNLPTIALGDSDRIHRGDYILLLGYPDYASNMLSWTEGVITTFDSEWIKTDALASYGHSGGMGIDENGRQIGVITRGESTGMDEKEVLSQLRPINMAKPLIGKATGRPSPVWTPQPTPERGVGKRMVVLGAEGLNLRTGPGLQYPKLIEMPLGSVLDVLQAPQWDGARFWYNVRMLSTGLEGWASEFFLAPYEIATAPILFVSDEAGSQDIYQINPDGSGRIRLTSAVGNEADPSWSPDRRQIVFSYFGQGDTDLYIMNADGTAWQQLTNLRGEEVHPVWSPDGRRIAYVSNADGDWEIYLLDLDTRRVRQLTFNTGWDSFPSWSPDGMQLVFTSRQTGNYDLFLLDVSSGGQAQLTTSPYSDAHGTWSPRGNEIVYTMVVEEGGRLARGIGVIDVRNPTRPQHIKFGETGTLQFAYPDWSPDGRFIIFVAGEAPWFELYAAPARGSTAVKLTSATSQSSIAPTWSR